MRKNILISAYAISPVRGSEYGAAWNTVMHLAKDHNLWVLYGMSDDHMGDTYTLREYIKNNPIPSVTFVEVRATRLANATNYLNKVGIGWAFYAAYYLWQKQVLEIARAVLETVQIDVIHQLGPIGFREPGFLGRLNKPLVWGPIGGMMVVNRKLLKGKPIALKAMFLVKNIINAIQLNGSKRIKDAFKRADVLIAATSAGQKTIVDTFGRHSYLLPEQGVNAHVIVDRSKFDSSKPIELVWSGSHIGRKNLEMCLDALANIKQTNWVLNILGSGPLTASLKKKAQKLNLAGTIKWHGQLARTEAVDIMAKSHLHIITSIAEDNPAVIFEAMGSGVPTLTIDHCGMGDVICSKCGIKITIDDYDVMVKKMAATIDHLLLYPEILEEMSQTTLACADNFEWVKRSEKLNDIYDEAILRYKKSTVINVNVKPLNTLQNAW